jgi:hypothetical protein
MVVLTILGWIFLCLIGLVILMFYMFFGYLLVRYLVDTHKEKKLKRLKEKGD